MIIISFYRVARVYTCTYTYTYIIYLILCIISTPHEIVSPGNVEEGGIENFSFDGTVSRGSLKGATREFTRPDNNTFFSINFFSKLISRTLQNNVNTYYIFVK